MRYRSQMGTRFEEAVGYQLSSISPRLLAIGQLFTGSAQSLLASACHRSRRRFSFALLKVASVLLDLAILSAGVADFAMPESKNSYTRNESFLSITFLFSHPDVTRLTA